MNSFDKLKKELEGMKELLAKSTAEVVDTEAQHKPAFKEMKVSGTDYSIKHDGTNGAWHSYSVHHAKDGEVGKAHYKTMKDGKSYAGGQVSMDHPGHKLDSIAYKIHEAIKQKADPKLHAEQQEPIDVKAETPKKLLKAGILVDEEHPLSHMRGMDITKDERQNTHIAAEKIKDAYRPKQAPKKEYKPASKVDEKEKFNQQIKAVKQKYAAYKNEDCGPEMLKLSENGQWSLSKDDMDAKIAAKMRAEMDKRGFSDKDAADHMRDIDENIPAVQRSNMKNAIKQQKAPKKPSLKVVKEEELEKSNEIKPFGQNVYDEKANMRRKANRTGETVPGVGRNNAVHRYTTISADTQRAHEASQASHYKKNPAPVKQFSPEEIKTLQSEKEVKKDEGNLDEGETYGLHGAPELKPGQKYSLSSHSATTGNQHYSGEYSSKKRLRTAANSNDLKHGAAMTHKVAIVGSAMNKDDEAHEPGSPADSAHDVVEDSNNNMHQEIKSLSPAQREIMLQHLRTLRDKEKHRSPSNKEKGKD